MPSCQGCQTLKEFPMWRSAASFAWQMYLPHGAPQARGLWNFQISSTSAIRPHMTTTLIGSTWLTQGLTWLTQWLLANWVYYVVRFSTKFDYHWCDMPYVRATNDCQWSVIVSNTTVTIRYRNRNDDHVERSPVMTIFAQIAYLLEVYTQGLCPCLSSQQKQINQPNLISHWQAALRATLTRCQHIQGQPECQKSVFLTLNGIAQYLWEPDPL